MALRWDDVDRKAGELRLRDSKTGPCIVPLTACALNVLDGMERIEGNPWVFPAKKGNGCLPSLHYNWQTVRARAGLSDVRLHDLCHSLASRALALGESLPMIGKLLCHARVETTARYAHLTRESVREAAERIAANIADDIL